AHVLAKLEREVVLPDGRGEVERRAHRALAEAPQREEARAQDLEEIVEADRAFQLDDAAEVERLVGTLQEEARRIQRRELPFAVHGRDGQVGFGHRSSPPHLQEPSPVPRTPSRSPPASATEARKLLPTAVICERADQFFSLSRTAASSDGSGGASAPPTGGSSSGSSSGVASRSYCSAISASRAAWCGASSSRRKRQLQLPSGRPGTFMRASLPSARTSCTGAIAVSATDDIAARIRSQAMSSPLRARYRCANERSAAGALRNQPTVVSLSCVPV